MNLVDELFSVVDCLERDGIEYAICGGIAVLLHGYPRLTKDIDILVRETDQKNVEYSVSKAGYLIKSGILPFDVGTVSERKIFRITKIEGQDFLSLDFLIVSPRLEEVWQTRENKKIEKRTIVVVSKQGLAKMKRLSNRPQDVADLANLGLENDHDS